MLGKLYLLGHPVGHSRSPAMHNAAYRALGLDWEYGLMDRADEEGARAFLDGRGWLACNVTTPWKPLAYQAAVRRSVESELALGANVLVNWDGVLHADNTDGRGCAAYLKRCGVSFAGARVCVCGTDDANEIRRIVGYVPEFPELDRHLTVAETLYMEAYVHGLEQNEIAEGMKKALSIADLEEVADQKVGTLSKGYAQRTSFAKALCFGPEVLILDEFSGGLDPAQTVRLRRAVKKLSEHMIVIQSTHRIEEAEQLCDYIYVMNRGTVAARGSLDDIVRESGKGSLEEAFLSLTDLLYPCTYLAGIP